MTERRNPFLDDRQMMLALLADRLNELEFEKKQLKKKLARTEARIKLLQILDRM